jgi:bifunctional UDP-N-acetylglucosamine pyrophosphorylase/glucosamine-1-phosphate N-acetyltransferase
VVILAAGQGKRMKSARAKVLHPLCGRPMIAWVVEQALAIDPDRILIVVGHGADEVEGALRATGQFDRVQLVLQEPQLGTGHALQCCSKKLFPVSNRVVVLYGDMPLLRARSVSELLGIHAASADTGAAILTACPIDPRGFGRILRDEEGVVQGIVEERDATPEEREIDEVNLGVYVFDGPALAEALPMLSKANDQGEYYLTDVIGTFVEAGRPVVATPVEDEAESIGVNTLAHLAEARDALQMRILERHLENGVQIEDPHTTVIDHGVQIGAGTRILPCTVLRSGVRIGTGCEVGPFSHLRAGTVLEDGAEIGNFTECKNSSVGSHAKAKHLAYLGDATIGAGTNVGAGTIFANYDGVAKHRTLVGKKAFLGSGTVVVAPNRIGDRATTGAGAILRKNSNVPAGEIWVGIPARRLERPAAAPVRRGVSGTKARSPARRKARGKPTAPAKKPKKPTR